MIPRHPQAPAEIRQEWQAYATELGHAERAAELAAKYERQLDRGPESMRPFRARMAALHRRMEIRHSASARLHRLHALRLQRWHEDARRGLRPVFLAAAADRLRMDDASMSLFDREHRELFVAAAGPVARASHDIELSLGEGPSRDALDSASPILVAGSALRARWPHYGTAITDLGIRAVLAAPLPEPFGGIGTLCGFALASSTRPLRAEAAAEVAEAVAQNVALAVREAEIAPEGIVQPAGDLLSEINIAVGMTAAQYSCSADTALALLRAQAFADGRTVADLAHHLLTEDRER